MNVVRAVTTGSSGTPSAASAGSMKKPKPSDTISIGMPAAWALRTNGTNLGSCGWRAAVASSAAGSASTSDISQAISRREPMPPASYSAEASSQTPGTCSAMTMSVTSVSEIVPS